MPSPPLACVAALVGFRDPLPVKGAGILRRSGVHVLLFSRPEVALRLLRTELTVAVAVFDFSNDAVRELARDFLGWFESLPQPTAPRVVVASDRTLDPDLRQSFADLGAISVARTRLNYRHLALVLRALVSLPTDNHPAVLRMTSLRRRSRQP